MQEFFWCSPGYPGCSTLTGTLLRDQGPWTTRNEQDQAHEHPRQIRSADTARPRDVVFETRRIPTDCWNGIGSRVAWRLGAL